MSKLPTVADLPLAERQALAALAAEEIRSPCGGYDTIPLNGDHALQHVVAAGRHAGPAFDRELAARVVRELRNPSGKFGGSREAGGGFLAALWRRRGGLRHIGQTSPPSYQFSGRNYQAGPLSDTPSHRNRKYNRNYKYSSENFIIDRSNHPLQLQLSANELQRSCASVSVSANNPKHTPPRVRGDCERRRAHSLSAAFKILDIGRTN